MNFAPHRPIVLGIALAPKWATTLERAAELMRERQPGLDDATLLEKILVFGMVAIIDGENNNRTPRNGNDDVLVARAEAVL